MALTPIGNSLLKYTSPMVSSVPISQVFCKITGPSSNPSLGRKMVSPVLLSPRMIGQLIDDGPRYFGSIDG